MELILAELSEHPRRVRGAREGNGARDMHRWRVAFDRTRNVAYKIVPSTSGGHQAAFLAVLQPVDDPDEGFYAGSYYESEVALFPDVGPFATKEAALLHLMLLF
jgi:hypothetical protein